METQPYLKDGRLERAAFPPLLTAFIGLIVAFLLFQGISTVFLVVVTIASGTDLSMLLEPEGMATFLADNAALVIWANTVGQIFGLLLPGLWFARLHSSTVRSFLRIRPVDGRILALSVLGLLAFIPLVQFSASFFDSLPWPQWVRDLENGQMELIEQILTQDFSLMFAISMLALTPAICEEILFRGYIQRQAERSLGAWGGILFSGIIFGFYHLRLTQAIPLSLLGIFMAWLTWRTRSLWPAILVHLLNNSFAAVLGKAASQEGSNVDLEEFSFPLWATLVAAVVFTATVRAIRQRAIALQPAEQEAVPSVSGGDMSPKPGTEHTNQEGDTGHEPNSGSTTSPSGDEHHA